MADMKDPPDRSWLFEEENRVFGRPMSEVELEAYKAKQTTEQKRLELRMRTRMDGEDRKHVAIGVSGFAAAMLTLAAITMGCVSCGAQDTQQMSACVNSGGQWTQNLNHDYECVRK